jgi:hypothetical protein
MDFEFALENFMRQAQNLICTDYSNSGDKNFPALSIESGRKYVKIIKTTTCMSYSSRSVYCFVDKSNGDILKAATWKAPAKIARGNIYQDFKDAITPYGVGCTWRSEKRYYDS